MALALKLGGSMLLGAVAAGALLMAATSASAQGCSREDLTAAADSYIAAQETGDPFKMHMGLWVDYNEQMENSTMATGVLSKPMKVDFHRNVLDTATCKTFTEVVIADPAHPYVIGTVLSVGGLGGPGEISNINSVVTDKVNGWLFSPANTQKYSQAENWSEIPAADQDSRATLQAAADAYLDLFNNKNAKVPWGAPCARLEGGLYTSKSAPGAPLAPDDSCNVGGGLQGVAAVAVGGRDFAPVLGLGVLQGVGGAEQPAVDLVGHHRLQVADLAGTAKAAR